MKKTIRHSWSLNKGFKTAMCSKCGATKVFSNGFGRQVFFDRFGKLHYNTPECVLPNTRL